ncbi:preprotein translocase subunit SecE [Desulfatiglans anilini]|uniref:preprotein translocase subunit SecE n=1 Tax=Desulfatiglans anilini TaxID=90728 RepID=UPI00040301E0|nr:preprotein translocase subunit SecE [Desulfatiglans anilini]
MKTQEQIGKTDGGKAGAKTPVARGGAKKPSDKTPRKERSITVYIHRARQFLREVKMELRKVKWPTRKELIASTSVVIVLVMIISLYLGLVDFGLIKIIKGIVG